MLSLRPSPALPASPRPPALLAASRRHAPCIRAQIGAGDRSDGRSAQWMGQGAKRACVGLSAALLMATGMPGQAATIEKISEFAASGFIFKDSVEVLALDDPDIKGVTVYISDFRRSLTDKLAKDFFSEPSQASLNCTQSGKEIVVRNIDDIRGKEGKEIFAQQKNLNILQNKTLRVKRIYDEKRNTLVYISYSTRLTPSAGETSPTSSRYRTSICVVPLNTAIVNGGEETSPAGELGLEQ